MLMSRHKNLIRWFVSAIHRDGVDRSFQGQESPQENMGMDSRDKLLNFRESYRQGSSAISYNIYQKFVRRCLAEIHGNHSSLWFLSPELTMIKRRRNAFFGTLAGAWHAGSKNHFEYPNEPLAPTKSDSRM
jgi:hypothetical protein